MDLDKITFNKFFKQALFLLVLITTGFIIFWELKFFLSCFLGAVTLYVVLRRPMLYLTEKKNWNNVKASLLIVILSGIILIGFGAGAFNLLYSRIATADFSSLIDGVKVIGNKIYDLTGYHVIQQDFLNQFKGVLMSIVTNVLNATYNIGVNVFMMFVVLYFMLANVRKMERKIVSYSPFGSDSLNKIKSEVKNIIFSNAIGIPLIMFAQSVVASLGYWMLDIPDAIFWGFLTGLFGIVPLLGTTIIWLPMSVYLFATTSVWQALILLVYGALIVGNTDNVVRFVLLKKAANVHPLTTIFGVIMGIPLFGFWGIIFGPLLISCFLLLVKIYYSEYAVNK